MVFCVAAAAPLALAPPLVVSHAPLARTRITPIVPLRAAPPPRMQLDDDAIAQKMAAMRKKKQKAFNLIGPIQALVVRHQRQQTLISTSSQSLRRFCMSRKLTLTSG